MLASANAPPAPLGHRVRHRDGGRRRCGRAGACGLPALVSRARASHDAGGHHVPRRASGPAASAHEPIIAGALLDPRVCEERLRRPDHRRGGEAADRLAAQPQRVGHHRSFRHRARAVPRLRRPCGRHLPRDRQHTRAHQHAGGADVGAGHGAEDDDGAVRAAAGNIVERCDPAAVGHRRLLVQRAQPSVPDGQPGRIQPVLDAYVHRARREPHAGLPSGGASRRH